MNTAANPAFRPDAGDMRALNRALAWSLGVHVGVVAVCFVLPGDWLRDPPRRAITITLGGTPGPSSTGTASIGGRTVEQVAPPPRRPEPIRPTPKPPPASTPVTAPLRTKPSTTARPRPPAARAPTTGRQIARGNTPVETGARGQGAGLTFGGGGTGGAMQVMAFCCPEYLQLLTAQIDSNWAKTQPERGTAEIRFTIRRDGRVSGIELTQTSGSSVLDRISRAAITDLRPLPLPAAYPADTLTVRIRFPYEGS